MAAMKYIVCFLVLVAVSSAFELKRLEDISNNARIDKHNIISCDPDEKDSKILDRFYVEAKAHFLQIVEDSVTWPNTGIGQKIITCIRVTDLIGNNHGGYPVIEKGGLCEREVIFHFTSQRSRGFKFEVEIYGRDP